MKISHSGICNYITDKLLGEDKEDEIQRTKLLYCIDYILSELEHIIFFTVIFAAAGYLREYVMCWIAIGITRVYIGGIHMKTKEACFIFSFWVYLISIVLGQVAMVSWTGKLLVGAACLIILWSFAPFPSPQRPVYSDRKKREFRVKGSAGIVVVTVYALSRGHGMDCVIWILILLLVESVYVILKERLQIRSERRI